MCQITAYLDGEEIMKDVLMVEPVPEGVLLATFFEQPRIVPAVIRKLDLMKNKLFLESRTELSESEELDKSHTQRLAQRAPANQNSS
jgi:predicted RNA-binding protein